MVVWSLLVLFVAGAVDVIIRAETDQPVDFVPDYPHVTASNALHLWFVALKQALSSGLTDSQKQFE